MNTVYFARPMSAYNSPQDRRDVAMLKSMGYQVIEITDCATQAGAAGQGMRFFKPIVESADALFFRSFPDGNIGAGVGQEIEWAEDAQLPVLELPTHVTRRTLSAGETHEMLRYCGQR